MKRFLLIFFITIFVISGCVNKNSSEIENTITVINTNDNNEELKIDKIEINKVISTSKNYAIVSDNKNDVYIINSDNKLIGTINDSNSNSIYQINDNGYIYQNIDSVEKIYDRTGKELLISDKNIKYYFGISPSNLLIRKKKYNNIYRYEVVDVNNNIIVNDLKKELQIDETTPISIIYLGGNIYVINSLNNDYLYNIKLKIYKKVNNLDYTECSRKMTDSNNLEKCYFLINDNSIRINDKKVLIKNNLDIMNISKYDIILDEKYYYSDKDKSIKNFDGKNIKDMTLHNVVDSYIKDNNYYLATTKGIMILNSDLEQIGETIKIGKSIKKITPYGIIVNKESTKRESAIYDFNFKLIKDLENLYLYNQQDFISETFIDGVTKEMMPFNLKICDRISIIK